MTTDLNDVALNFGGSHWMISYALFSFLPTNWWVVTLFCNFFPKRTKNIQKENEMKIIWFLNPKTIFVSVPYNDTFPNRWREHNTDKIKIGLKKKKGGGTYTQETTATKLLTCICSLLLKLHPCFYARYFTGLLASKYSFFFFFFFFFFKLRLDEFKSRWSVENMRWLSVRL